MDKELYEELVQSLREAAAINNLVCLGCSSRDISVKDWEFKGAILKCCQCNNCGREFVPKWMIISNDEVLKKK